MNSMIEVANLLGVKLYEEFRIKNFYSNLFRITETSLEYLSDYSGDWELSNLITVLLNGSMEIEKISKPKRRKK